MSVYDSIITGLNEAIEHTQGKRKLKTNTLTIKPVAVYSAGEIKEIRHKVGASQSVFAGIMGVSIKTVEAWESGRNQPDGAARRLLSMMQLDPALPDKYQLISR